jgi:hypothetical protein
VTPSNIGTGLRANTSRLHRVTPQDFPLSKVQYATSHSEGKLLLSVLIHDPVRRKDQRRLWRFDPATGQWETVHNVIIDGPATDETSEGLPSLPVAAETRIRIAPSFEGDNETAEVWWKSPCGEGRLLIQNGAISLDEAPAASGTKWHFISWYSIDAGLIALVDEPDGQRRVMFSANSTTRHLWDTATLPTDSHRISGLTVFDGDVFISSDDARRGFTLWRHRAGKSFGHAESWEPVLDLGAFRYLLNAEVLELVSRPDALYLATGIKESTPSEGSGNSHAQRGFELLRFYPENDDWDLVVGQPRFTQQGLKVPLSGRGPGFNERDPLQLECFVVDASGLHIGVADAEGFQLWRLDETDHWKSAWPGAFTEYERVRISAAYPTAQGILLVAESWDFGGKDSLEIWLASGESIVRD